MVVFKGGALRTLRISGIWNRPMTMAIEHQELFPRNAVLSLPIHGIWPISCFRLYPLKSIWIWTSCFLANIWLTTSQTQFPLKVHALAIPNQTNASTLSCRLRTRRSMAPNVCRFLETLTSAPFSTAISSRESRALSTRIGLIATIFMGPHSKPQIA